MILNSELVQGSPAWLEWRRGGIGASDMAALFGVDPYGGTPRKLWEEKLSPPKAASEAAEAEHLIAGHQIEAMVRAMHEFDTGQDWPATCFEHAEFTFIRASLDGWNEASKTGVEIKLVMAAVIGTAIPPHHLYQLQQQMLVTDAESFVYIRHSRSSGQTEKITVAKDLNMQRDILSKCWWFWDLVQKKESPPYVDADWVEDGRPEIVVEAMAWKEARTTAERKGSRDMLLVLAKRPRTLCAGVKIQSAPFAQRVWLQKDGSDD